MDTSRFQRLTDYQWQIKPFGDMRVPGIIFASEQLIREMDDKVYEQVTNVAALPGIQRASYAMPDAHWGYGFPVGGVAAFDPDEGGVVSAGGVGFDISCGVRTMHTGLTRNDIEKVKTKLADVLYGAIPAGVGSRGNLRLDSDEMTHMLMDGAKWAVQRGYGVREDLERIEEQGKMSEAHPENISDQAKKRQRDEMGTLGSGNHYLEVQEVVKIFDVKTGDTFGISKGDIVVSVHCGSRGLGHQIGTDYLKSMVVSGVPTRDRELASARINSSIGQSYLGAMRGAINCALANRQIISHLIHEAFARVLPHANLRLLYDVSHNTCKMETHTVDGKTKKLFVHRKGATRAFGPGHLDIPEAFRDVGQPVLIGGTMGTASYILAGTNASMNLAFGSAVHGAGRSMSRHQALKRWKGRQVIDDLAQDGILIRSPSQRGVAEEAPGAYKDVSAVVDAADHANLARKAARLEPIICIKG